MGKIRKVLICILTVCMIACASVALAGAGCNEAFPDFKNPTQSTVDPGNTDSDNRYTIKVQSMGGLALSGVQVNLKKNGANVVSGISKNGEIVVYAEPDDYELEVDETSLPAGYKVPEETVKTGEEKEVTVKLPSGVINTTASSSTRYTLGNVLYDFSFTYNYTEDGQDKSKDYLLSDLVSEYKAVVINFFFTSCGPCNVEFPFMQKAYEEFSDRVALVALADPKSDSATVVKNFAARGGYTFPMARDNAGLHTFFQIKNWPTTVVIDRYGIFVYRDSGTNPSESSWKALFARYTSDNYTTDPNLKDPDEGDEPEVVENKKPTGVTESDYKLMPAQIAPYSTDKVVKFETETNEKDAEYNWSWVVSNDSDYTYLTASNSGQDPSFSIIYVELDLKFGDIVSFDYNLKSLDGYDMFIVILDSTTPLLQISGDSKGWQTMNNIFVANADGHYTFSFTYMKYYDSKKAPLDSDYARIKNISVVNVADTDEAMDVARSIYHEGLTKDNILLNPNDGYYHIANTGNPDYDGALVLIDLWNRTPWSMAHTNSNTFTPEGETGYCDVSMYRLSFWLFSNRGGEEDERLVYQFLTTEEGNYLNFLLDVQLFSDNEYLPVDETLQKILVKFIAKFNAERNNYFYTSTECEPTDWIEMCYFYQHYNSENYKHTETVTDSEGNVTKVERECYVHSDPVKGMSYMSAYDAVINDEGDDSFPNHVDVTKTNTSNNGGGIYYKFTVPKSGVYLFNTDFVPNSGVDPQLILYRLNPGQTFPVVFHSIYYNISYDALERGKVIPILDENGNPVKNEDGTDKVDRTNEGALTNAFGYVYLTAGEVIYVQGRQYMMGITGKFDFSVKYVGESYDWLCVASTAEGMFIGEVDENGNLTGDSSYGGIDAGYDMETGYYREQLKNGDFGSVIYIDFIHANYFDTYDNSLEDMLDIKVDGYGFFNLRGKGERDYTDKIRQYIEKSKEGKSEDDELYGLLEADIELVQIISKVFEVRGSDQDGYNTGYWLSVACYYQHVGA